jgi:hypothetical protein
MGSLTRAARERGIGVRVLEPGEDTRHAALEAAEDGAESLAVAGGGGGLEPQVLTPLDPTLTLTRTQCPAKVGNTENGKPFIYAGFAPLCNAQQPVTAHS